MTDKEFTKYLKDQGFPADYRKLIMKLHKAHPSWVFKAGNTGLDWNYVVDKESANGVSTVNYVYPLYYRSTEVGAYNKSTKKYYKIFSARSMISGDSLKISLRV